MDDIENYRERGTDDNIIKIKSGNIDFDGKGRLRKETQNQAKQ
jgi:hypothetical protein